MTTTQTPAPEAPEFDYTTRSSDEQVALQVLATLEDLFTNHMTAKDKNTGKVFSAAHAIEDLMGRPVQEILNDQKDKTVSLVQKMRSDEYIVCAIVDEQLGLINKELRAIAPPVEDKAA
jgi:hypothetical protein